MDFVGHHIRRTSMTVAIHCSLPFVYTVGLWLITLDQNQNDMVSLGETERTRLYRSRSAHQR